MAKLWIEDRDHAEKREWLLDRLQQRTEDYKDYAIVARFLAPDTDQLAVVAAGIGGGGTVAAGEFLVDEHRMGKMLKQLPNDWQKKNIEVVLETQVIRARSGPPRVKAVHVWQSPGTSSQFSTLLHPVQGPKPRDRICRWHITVNEEGASGDGEMWFAGPYSLR